MYVGVLYITICQLPWKDGSGCHCSLTVTNKLSPIRNIWVLSIHLIISSPKYPMWNKPLITLIKMILLDSQAFFSLTSG